MVSSLSCQLVISHTASTIWSSELSTAMIWWKAA